MRTHTERLEIRLPAHSVALLRKAADRRGVSMGQLVREAIDMLLREDRDARMRAAEALFKIEGPVADWPQMEREIEAAHLEDEAP